MDGLKEKERREIGLESLESLWELVQSTVTWCPPCCHSLTAFLKTLCPRHMTAFYMQTAHETVTTSEETCSISFPISSITSSTATAFTDLSVAVSSLAGTFLASVF